MTDEFDACMKCRELSGDPWSPPRPESRGGRRRFVARARGRLLRLARCARREDAFCELECLFRLQVGFILRHPEVPRRMMAWLSKEGDAPLRHRIRRVIDHYASRIAAIIGRAKAQGLVRADIDPMQAAMRLVGIVQGLALGIGADPRQDRLAEASNAFLGFRASLAPSSP